MPFARIAAVLLAAAVFAPAAGAARTLPAPNGLTAFLVRLDEAAALRDATHTFPRTPAFGWKPVAGAKRYDFELSTSRTFSEGSLVWSSADSQTVLTSPATSVPVALPWITGNPYSLYGRARGVTSKGIEGRWSKPYGFNVRWRERPDRLDPQSPGLVRWTPVEGATAYEVWLAGARTTFLTTTNVADLRELYTFHNGPAWTQWAAWRVRAVRRLYGSVPNGLPRETRGPWSDWQINLNPPFATGMLQSLGTVSGSVTSTAAAQDEHELTPGFLFSGNSFDGVTTGEFFRVYVFTDSDCVNRVYTGALVGSPAYAPRVRHALAFPTKVADLDTLRGAASPFVDAGWPTYGDEGATRMLDGSPVEAVDEKGVALDAGDGVGGKGGGLADGKIDLWENASASGGYYWTVVPVIARPVRGGTELEYRDLYVVEDVCRAFPPLRFGKVSKPIVLGGKVPHASGLSPAGRMMSANTRRPRFYGFPLVAWEPALGATEYEVQWSRRLSPWKAEASIVTPATSAVLTLKPGLWHYRVRGLNQSLPVKPQMSWSQPVTLRIARPMFRVVRSGR